MHGFVLSQAPTYRIEHCGEDCYDIILLDKLGLSAVNHF